MKCCSTLFAKYNLAVAPIMKCCSTLFFVLFRNTHSARLFGGYSHYMLMPNFNVEKTIEQQKQSPGGVL